MYMISKLGSINQDQKVSHLMNITEEISNIFNKFLNYEAESKHGPI